MTSLSIQGGASVAFGSASVIATQGLIVALIDEDSTDGEKLEAAEEQLETNRANCEGMDQVAESLTSIIESSSLTLVCKDKFDDDCEKITDDSKTLIVKVTKLLQLSSQNIEDSSISTVATEIITFLSSTTITILSYEQRDIIITLIEPIRFTVLIYVSQITVIESKKFEIAGAITFSGATISIDEVDKQETEVQVTVLTAQLTNLFQISDANDKVLECIAKIEDLPTATNPEPNSELSSNVQKVPAMCGAAEPPVEEIQETAASITQICSSLTTQPTQAELNILVFIKQSLITFKQTFITQITIFSQKLSIITKTEVITAASLGVEVISSSGEIEVATAVDITGGFEEGSVDYYVYRIEVLQSSLNAIIDVLERITEILSLSSDDSSASSSSFALSVSTLSATLSSGAFTIDIMTLAQSVLQIEVTVLPSSSIILLLESVQSTLQSIQLTIISQVTMTMEILFQQTKTLSSISFTILSFESSGKIVSTEVAVASQDENSSTEEIETYLQTLEDNKLSIIKIEELTQAALNSDFSSIETAVKEVTVSYFITQLTSLLVVVSENITDSAIVALSSTLMELKFATVYYGAIENRFQFILFLFKSFITEITLQIQVFQEILDERIGTQESVSKNPVTEKPLSEEPGTEKTVSENPISEASTTGETMDETISSNAVSTTMLELSNKPTSFSTEASTNMDTVTGRDFNKVDE